MAHLLLHYCYIHTTVLNIYFIYKKIGNWRHFEDIAYIDVVLKHEWRQIYSRSSVVVGRKGQVHVFDTDLLHLSCKEIKVFSSNKPHHKHTHTHVIVEGKRPEWVAKKMIFGGFSTGQLCEIMTNTVTNQYQLAMIKLIRTYHTAVHMYQCTCQFRTKS